MTFFLLTLYLKSLIMRVQKGRKQMDNYFTQLSLLYSTMPPAPTDDELDMMEALAQLIRQKKLASGMMTQQATLFPSHDRCSNTVYKVVHVFLKIMHYHAPK